ncbi:MAG: hypothetical protein K9N55_03695 [Phycisphaerae bacterium]|nr:hypothetical protein [Phycisphaerae bacterium]
MKFFTLLKKELRESLVLMVLALLAFTVLAGLSIRDFGRRGGDDYQNYVRKDYTQLFHHAPVNETGDMLMFISMSLGVALGILHFWVPLLTRTWSFLLHRSVSRAMILSSKILCAALAFAGGLGIPWIWAHWYVNHVRTTGFPPNPRVLWEGWLFIGLGFTLYLGIALSAMTSARWYTTRFFGVIFTIFVLCWVFTLSSISAALGLLAVSLVILLGQLGATFSTREF